MEWRGIPPWAAKKINKRIVDFKTRSRGSPSHCVLNSVNNAQINLDYKINQHPKYVCFTDVCLEFVHFPNIFGSTFTELYAGGFSFSGLG